MSTRAPRGDRTAAVRTFLIADIRGYTRFTTQHGDEAASRLARKFAEVVAEGVEAWDGDLVEVRGDEALAVFDSGRQALRCALELQDALADETALEPGLPLAVGIGVETGEAVPVDDGYRGAALNVAARLCALAAAGEILATDDLIRLAGPVPGIAFSSRAPQELKGIDRPVTAVAVTALTPDAHPPRPEAAGSTTGQLPPELEPIVPLAGRAAELRWLRWHWRRARHGHGRTIVVSGPPGIGKTRMAAELAALVHAGGFAVRYLPSALGATADDLVGGHDRPPSLIVVDDVDAAPSQSLRVVADVSIRATDTPVLLLLTHRKEAAAALVAVVEPLATPGRRRALGPLEADAVRAIAALYAGRAPDEPSLDGIVEGSGGVPAAVHRVAAQWARSSAISRLGVSADRTEAGRRTLREAEEALVGDVADLELVRERSRQLEPAAAGTGAQPPITICPYKGLAAFETVDADYYFGRDRLVAELVARLVGNPFLGLVGASGSGKSSALRAGLLPALSAGVLPGSGRWLHVVMRPGEHPLNELAHAVARADTSENGHPSDAEHALSEILDRLEPGRQLLLAIDQFEEVFGTTRDEAERGAFIRLITAPRPGLKVVVAVRADYYGHCAPYPSLARPIGSSHVLVGPLTSAELASVIEAPAHRVGLRVEPELVDELVTDAGTEAAVLPLLSTALLELWQRRESGWLTLAAYRAGGGLRGAVARLAESAFTGLDPGQAEIARSIFLRLAGPGEGEGLVRRRVSLEEFDAARDPAVAQVLDTLTSARLLSTGDGYVEVTHEALLREWPRLQTWLEEDAAGRKQRLHLIGAVRDWEQRGREPADLYRGARLSAALDWAAEHPVELNAAERDFLEASRIASEREVERERRTNRRLRGLLVGAALLLVVAVGAGVVALTQANAARDQAALAHEREDQAVAARQDSEAARQEAEAAARFARSRELAASAINVLARDPSLAKALAVSSGELVPPDFVVESALHATSAGDRVVHRYVVPTDAKIGHLTADVSPDGTMMVLSGGQFEDVDDEVRVVATATDEVLWSYEPPASAAGVGQAFFTPDGTEVVAGIHWEPDKTEWGTMPPPDLLGVVVWDARTGRLLRRLDTGPCGSQLLSVSASAALTVPAEVGPLGDPSSSDPLAKAGAGCFGADYRRGAVLVDLRSGLLTKLAASTEYDGVLSRDGGFAAFSDVDDGDRVVVVRLSDGREVMRLDPSTVEQRVGGFVQGISADGSRILYGDKPIAVIDVATATVIGTLSAAQVFNYGAAFGPSDPTIYVSGQDRTLRVWADPKEPPIITLPTAGGGRTSVTDDGRVLVADYQARTVSLVEPWAHGEIGTYRGCSGGFVYNGSLQVSGNSAAFIIRCPDAVRAYVVDLTDQSVRTTIDAADGQEIAVSPEGTAVALQISKGEATGPIEIRDRETGRSVRQMAGICTWDTTLGDPTKTAGCNVFPKTPFGLFNGGLRFSPDGRFLAGTSSLGYDQFLAVWDARTGRLIDGQRRDLAPLSIIFTMDSEELIASTFPDGRLVAISTRTWDVTRQVSVDQSVFGREGIKFGGFLSDGTLVGITGFFGTGGAGLVWIDPSTLEVVRSLPAHDGAARAIAVSADGTLIATGASDGDVRVWDGTTGSLLHELQISDVVQGVAFEGDDRVVVAPQAGDLLIMSIDPDRLLKTVAASLTRGFTPEECDRFGFVSPITGSSCPTLEELRAAGS